MCAALESKSSTPILFLSILASLSFIPFPKRLPSLFTLVGHVDSLLCCGVLFFVRRGVDPLGRQSAMRGVKMALIALKIRLSNKDSLPKDD